MSSAGIPARNVAACRRWIEALAARGVTRYCVCAGSRNAAWVGVLTAASSLEVYSFFEERSAAFFALGWAKREGAPVAIVTTSGTAAAELLPALIESHYASVPLVAVTADRPARYRGTGAPQSIEQKNLFGDYVGAHLDLDATSAADLASWDGTRSLHLNLAFEEPLIDEALPEALTFEGLESDAAGASAPGPSGGGHPVGAGTAILHQAAETVETFLALARRPLVILGALDAADRPGVVQGLRKLGAPIYAESLSGLRESPELASLILQSGERVLRKELPDAVLRIGGVPTLRFWRDLEADLAALPVLSVSPQPFAGLTRGQLLRMSPGALLAEVEPKRISWPEIFALDAERALKLKELFFREPTSEPGLLHALSRTIPEKSRVYLGNSLPIREWDLSAHRRSRGIECGANRGANGIDGQLSTFFGFCEAGASNWAILGDLTLLYDLASPWVLPQLLESLQFQIVVINNRGGRIFRRVSSLKSVEPRLREEFFENPHELRFEDWAKMWKLGYVSWERVGPEGPASARGVIELRPDPAATERFWQAYESI